MIDRMRRRFIGVAMAAAFCVITILVIVINSINSYVTVHQMDLVLSKIAGTGEHVISQTETYKVPDFPPLTMGNGNNVYTTLFLRVFCDKDGNITSISNDNLKSVSDEDAALYTKSVSRKKGEKGFYKEFRWMTVKNDSGSEVIFLDASAQISMMKVFINISGIIEIFTLLILFFILWIFSDKAVGPFANNIEHQKQFITNAGHEIKTPLTSIIASADILAMDYKDNEWIENIQRQASRMTKLVNNLVTLSRLDEETPFPDQIDFSLSDAAKSAAQPFVASAKAKGKTFTQTIEEGLTLHGDLIAIHQMISILLDNAIKYSVGDGDIQLKVYRKHRNILIDVSNKCDLKEIKDLNRIFERFYRIDKSHNVNTGGNGIGLSIAEAVAKAHKGSITAESRDGKSIRIRVIL